MNDLPGMEESRNRLSLSPSPSRESNASNLEDDLDLSSPNSSIDKTRGCKDSGNHSDKQDPSPKSSRENTPEKRKSSDRDNSSSDREKTPDEETTPSKTKSTKSVESPNVSKSPSTSKEAPSTSKDSPSTSKDAPSTSKDSPSTSKDAPSTSSSKPPKRKSSESEEELRQAIKRFKRQDEDRMKMQVLVSNFSEEQLNRYEMYRRATFPRPSVKKLMQSITGSTVSQNVVIAMSGIAKVFVGEVLETALDVSEKWGDSGPLHPKHLREAVRVLHAKGMMPSTKNKKCLF